MKKIWITIGCIIAAGLIAAGGLLVYVTGQAREKDAYNEAPDLSQKVVGSKGGFGDFADYPSLDTEDDLVRVAEVIIVGEVIGDGEASKFNMYGDETFAKQMLEMGRDPYMNCTLTRIRVEETIYGDLAAGSEFDLFQLGIPDSDAGQTKVQKGERLVMLLRGDMDKDGTYYSANVEHTMFYLDDNDTVTSMSDELVCARYDGTSKAFLIRDLLDAMERKSGN